MQALAHAWRADEEDRVLDGAPEVATADRAESVAELVWVGVGTERSSCDGCPPGQGAASGDGGDLAGCGEARQGSDGARIGVSVVAPAVRERPAGGEDRDGGGKDDDRGGPVRDRAGEFGGLGPRSRRVSEPGQASECVPGAALGHGAYGDKAGERRASPQHAAGGEGEPGGAEAPGGPVHAAAVTDRAGAARRGPPLESHSATGPCSSATAERFGADACTEPGSPRAVCRSAPVSRVAVSRIEAKSCVGSRQRAES